MNVRRCTRCVMDDSSDMTISFDSKGVCNYCTEAFSQMGKAYFPNEEGKRRLESLIKRIKKDGKNREFDCVMGLSGGLDSSYLAYLGHRWGLRILAIHIDDGYDTEISKSNIRKLIAATGFSYKVVTPDADQYNALVKAYMRAGVPNIDVPQDNILFAYIYECVKKYKIKYFLSGGNFALESILQRGNIYKAFDVINIRDIHAKYGDTPIDKLKFISTRQLTLDRKLYGVKTERPLDLIDYNRNNAFKELEEFCGFQYYGRKHLENILTAFIQLYWFPIKFGVDKRTSHLSSMIVSGQMSREDALMELKEPLYDEKQMNDYISTIKDKMGLTDEEFEKLIQSKLHMHSDFKVEDDLLSNKLIQWGLKALIKLKHIRG